MDPGTEDKSIEQPLRAENSVGAGQPSEKQTIKTLEEAPEGPPLNVIVKAQGSETLKLIWEVGIIIIYILLPLASIQHISSVQMWSHFPIFQSAETQLSGCELNGQNEKVHY